MIAPAVLIAVGLIVAIIEARIAIGEFDVLLMGVYVVVGTIINLALIFFALWAAKRFT